jgi:diaminohydroxyphosphoribosylaminopyrimidine deaminase / 5-amino-6-(5-phosphoribosylamino)uracil reductase
LNYEFYMQLALDEAWKYQGLTYPNPAVGALLLDINGKIIACEAHQEAGKSHAEINVLKSAFIAMSSSDKLVNMITQMESSVEIHEFITQHHNGVFEGCTIYVTLEPCAHFGKTPPCALLLGKLGLTEVIIGIKDPKSEHTGGIALLEKNGVHVVCGILEKKAKALLEPFMKWQESQFIFFKHAQHLNGVIDGGVVSCEASRKHVHALRNKIDLLIISGETVRKDRPTLDARMVDGRAPDVLIYSKQTEFDKTIPLFNVEERTIMISDTLDILKKYKFIMIEGGSTLFESLKLYIDWHLIYIAPTMKQGKHFLSQNSAKTVYSHSIEEDILIYQRLQNAKD